MTAIRIAVIVALAAPQGAFAQASSASSASRAATAGRAVPLALPVAASALPLMTPALTAPALHAAALTAPAPALAPAVLAPAAPLALAPAPAAARPTAVKPSTPALETAKAVSAASAPDARRPGQDAPESADPGKPLFDGTDGKYKAFIVIHGRSAVEVPLAGAGRAAKRARLLVSPQDPSGVSEKDAAEVKARLGAGAKLETDKLAVRWTAAPEPTAGVPAARLSPLREARFLAKAFVESLVRPTASEVIGGVVTKAFPVVTTIGVFWATIGATHPAIFAALVALNLAQQVFHGAFLKSWNNFQERLSRERGFNYQMFFNLAYMQGAGMIYRGLSWIADPKAVIPPWSPAYWKDVAVMSVLGTFFGTLGYNGLNALYAKGAIGRWRLSAIQQLRDLFFLLAGPFFATGSMGLFWLVFALQQSIDLAIGLWAGRAAARPVVIVVSAAVAASPEFRAAFPADGLKTEAPLKQAARAMLDNPVTRILTWPVRAIVKALKKRREGTR